MMIRYIYISILMVLGALLPLHAQTSVELSLPRRASVGTPFSLSIVVNNPNGNISTPKAPNLAGCTLAGGPSVSSSSSTSYINGVMTSSQTKAYTYHYVSEKEGTVKVPAVTVNVGGKDYTTSPSEFQVSAAGSSSGSGGGYYQQPAAYPTTQSTGFEASSKDVYMRYVVSRSSVYAQQPVEVSLKIYTTKQQVSGLAASSRPTLDGCLSVKLPDIQTIQWQAEKVGDRTMYSAVVDRTLVYPQRTGEISIGGGEYNATVYTQTYIQDWGMMRPVTQTKDITLVPQTTKIEVKPLPQPQPAGFSGGVGDFKVTANLHGGDFKTNEAATITYTITGTGNIKFLDAPRPDFPAEFEVYEPNVNVDARVSGANMTGTQTIEYTFVPQAVGKFTIGEYTLCYFNPVSGSYVTASAPGFEINVAKGAEVATGSAASGKQDVTVKNTDIHYIKVGADMPAQSASYMAMSLLYWLVYPVFILAFVIGMLIMYRISNADRSQRRLKSAGKVARKRLSKAGNLLKAKQYDSYYEELLRAMQTYLIDKLQIPASQLSREKIQEMLLARGASDELLGSLNNVLNDCEMARYTPQSSGAAEATFQQARQAINDIENLRALKVS